MFAEPFPWYRQNLRAAHVDAELGWLYLVLGQNLVDRGYVESIAHVVATLVFVLGLCIGNDDLHIAAGPLT